jgi:hypothetical protein
MMMERPGMRKAANAAAKELAIQLNQWLHLSLLETDSTLAKETAELFSIAQVRVPPEWCSEVRRLSLLV